MMTKEEIIEMAQRCGLFGIRPYPDGTYSEALEDFAKLIAEKECDECVKRANIALLGTLTTTKNRVLKAIRARRQE